MLYLFCYQRAIEGFVFYNKIHSNSFQFNSILYFIYILYTFWIEFQIPNWQADRQKDGAWAAELSYICLMSRRYNHNDFQNNAIEILMTIWSQFDLVEVRFFFENYKYFTSYWLDIFNWKAVSKVQGFLLWNARYNLLINFV